jgi:hypothetical protein
MTDYKDILGLTAVAIAFASYISYFWGIYKGQIKPHAFTWFAWGVLTSIGFAASFTSGGGSGSWVMLVNIICCLTISFIAFRQGHVKYVLFDWLALAGALIGIGLWWYTNNPLTAIILACVSDTIALLPSVRKAYYYPNEESVKPWAIGILYYVIGFFALDSVNLTTTLYPATIILTDIFFIFEVIIRRRQIKKAALR